MIEDMEAELTESLKKIKTDNSTVTEEAKVDESITAEAKARKNVEIYLKKEKNTQAYKKQWPLILKILTHLKR